MADGDPLFIGTRDVSGADKYLDNEERANAAAPSGVALRQRVIDPDSLAELQAILAALAGTLSVTGPLTDAELRASDVAVSDDYTDGEALPEQSGSDSSETFTFSSPVNLVVVESEGEGLVSRVDPFGGTPTATTGAPARHETPVYLPVIATTVRVFIPSGATVNVWGFRR